MKQSLRIRSIRTRNGGGPDRDLKLLPPQLTAPGRYHLYKKCGRVRSILGPCFMLACEGRGYTVPSSSEERNVVECDGVTVTPSLAHIMNRNKFKWSSIPLPNEIKDGGRTSGQLRRKKSSPLEPNMPRNPGLGSQSSDNICTEGSKAPAPPRFIPGLECCCKVDMKMVNEVGVV